MSGSLISENASSEQGQETTEESTKPAEQGGEAGSETDISAKLDPFNDANEYKDENGLYLGKYKSITDVMKGYKEQSKLLREKNPETPETYEGISFKDDQDIPEAYRDIEVNAENDPLFKAFVPVFKEGKFSQAQVNLIVKNHLLQSIANEPDLNKEREKLGADADKIISTVQGYAAKRNTPAMTKLATLAGRDGDLLKELNILIGASGEKRIPGELGGTGVESKSAAEWDAEARDYKKKNQKELDRGSQSHREHYYSLLRKASTVKS